MIHLGNKKVLIVEDDDMNFLYLKQIFKIVGGVIERVKTGQSAIDKSKDNDYDLIMMDIKLPDINGIEATQTIRTFNPTVIIIAQTAAKTPDEVEEAMNAGCNSVLLKPFKLEDLTNVLRDLAF